MKLKHTHTTTRQSLQEFKLYSYIELSLRHMARFPLNLLQLNVEKKITDIYSVIKTFQSTPRKWRMN